MLTRDCNVEPLPNSNVISAVPLLPEGILVGGDGGAPLLSLILIGISSDDPDFDPLRTFEDTHFFGLLMACC